MSNTRDYIAGLMSDLEAIKGEEAQRRVLQARELALKERAQERHEVDVAGWPARQRSQNHHDIMARVVMMLLEGRASDWTENMVRDAVRCGRLAADLAYPKEG